MNFFELFSKYQKPIIWGALSLALIAFFDQALAVGIFLLTFFVVITVATAIKVGIKEKEFYALFLIVISIHLLAVMFIYFYHFYPFGGGEGDQFYYHKTAVELSERFRQGNFSIKGFDENYPYYYVSHSYPVIIGALYAITAPQIIIGQILNVWIVALSLLFLYLIVVEISGSVKKAFLIGMIANTYPSYIYFGSLLIRDAIIVFLSLFLLLMIIRLIKKFSRKNFIFLFIILGFLTHFRFYVGFIGFLTIIFSLLFSFSLNLKKKLIFIITAIIFLAVIPQLFAGQGWFGIDFFNKFINQETITSLREKEYKKNTVSDSLALPGSDVVVETGFGNPALFLKNSLKSFAYISLGPLPWQIKYFRQLFALAETFLWYFSLFFILRGILKSFKKYKIILPLVFFSIVTFLAISLFTSNFGTYMRIRMPAFLALLALADFNFNNNIFWPSFFQRLKKSAIIKKIGELSVKVYEKIMREKMTPNVYAFLKNLRYTIFGYSFAAFCVFAFEIMAGRILGAENYGKYVLSSIIALFLSLLTTIGTTIAVIKYIAREKNGSVHKKIITSAYLIVFFLIFFVSFLLFTFSSFISKLFFVPLDIFYLAILFAACFSLYSLAADILRGLSEIKKLSFLRMAYGVLIILFFIVFSAAGNVSFKTAVYVISISYFIVFLAVTKNLQSYISFKIDKQWVKKLLKYGIYAMVGGPLFTFLPRIGQIFVNKYLTVSDVGIYNAYYLSSVSVMVFFYTTFVVVFFPTASKYKEKGPILRKIKKIIPTLFLTGTPFLFLTQLIILKLYGREYPIDYFLMFLFAVSGILISIYGVMGWLFYSKNISGAKLITGLTILVAVASVLFNIFLIPLFSLQGAVLAIIFAYVIGIAFLFLFEKKLTSDETAEKYSEKIKICYVASVDTTFKFILFNHLKFLKNEGYNVYAVCSDGKWVEEIEKEGIKVKTIRIKRKISPFSDAIAFWKLFFYFKKEKFHIVHTHTLKPAFWAQMAARAAKVPIVVSTMHGFDFGKESSFLKTNFFLFLEKIAARQSDIIFSVSKKIIEDSVKIGICKRDSIKYLGDGVDLSRFDPARFSEEFVAKKKKELGIGNSKKVIGIVARLVEEKGYLDLFSALDMVLKKFPETLLLVIGQEEPEKKDAVKKDIFKKYRIENNVIYLGERTDMEEIYPLMDVFVLPSHREGLGVATIEASAMEKPAIVTNTGGCPETVDDGKTGILVPVKNPVKLAEAIIYIFENPEKVKEMGKAGREKIIKEFDEQLVFDRINKEYQNFIEKKLKKENNE